MKTIPELIAEAKVKLGREGELVPSGELEPHIPEDRKEDFWRYILHLARVQLLSELDGA